MPSKRRTEKDAKAKKKRKPKPGRSSVTVQAAAATRALESHPPVEKLIAQNRMSSNTANENVSRRVSLSFSIPRSTVISGASAVTGGAGLTVAIATGNVEPVFVWPCIALTALGMAYDLGRCLVDRRESYPR
ncbi:hypothetical protein [Streptomyces phaeochromogenes]|uniref:hypothetical protein n=1 Tax=Streptomyces phaeochromogenes TaxID=1923 RepID=UPI003714A77A